MRYFSICTAIVSLIAAFAGTLTSSAQNTEKRSRPVKWSESVQWSESVHLSYLLPTIVQMRDGYRFASDHRGFSAGWAASLKTENTGLTIEGGVDFGAFFRIERHETMTLRYSLTDIRFPLSVAYQFDIPGWHIGIMPLVGIDPGCFITGQTSWTNQDGTTESTKVFKKESGNSRFIFDCHAGVKAIWLSRYFLEYRYEIPIVPFYHDNSTNTSIWRHSIGVGLQF